MRDGEKEYPRWSKDLEEHGIEISTTTSYTPQNNGRAERTNRTIKNAIRTLLIPYGPKAKLWAKCLYAVWDWRNLIVHAGCTKTPEELITYVKPSVAHMPTFDCNDWAQVADKTRKTLKAKGWCGILQRCLSLGKYQIMMEDDGSVQTT